MCSDRLIHAAVLCPTEPDIGKTTFQYDSFSYFHISDIKKTNRLTEQDGGAAYESKWTSKF
jgi:hypothetical protein